MKFIEKGTVVFIAGLSIAAMLGLAACGSQQLSNSSENGGSGNVTASSTSAETLAGEVGGESEFVIAYKGLSDDGNMWYYAVDVSAEHTAIVAYNEQDRSGAAYIGPFTSETGESFSVTDEESGDKIVCAVTVDKQGQSVYNFDNGLSVVMETCDPAEVTEVLGKLGRG